MNEEKDNKFRLEGEYPARLYNSGEPIDAHLKVNKDISLKGAMRQWELGNGIKQVVVRRSRAWVCTGSLVLLLQRRRSFLLNKVGCYLVGYIRTREI